MAMHISKFEIVLTYSPIGEICGHLFECFDYFLFLRDYFKVGIMLCTGLDMDQVRIAFEDKYSVPWEEVEPHIVRLDITNLTKARIISFSAKTVVLLVDGNITSLRYRGILLSCKTLLGFMCYDYDFHKVIPNRHIQYLQDFRIYGRNKHFPSYDYVKKIPFQFYKIPSMPETNIGLMYITWVCRKVGKTAIESCFKESGCDSAYVVVPDIIPEYNNIPGITQVQAPMPNLLSSFRTYIYTPVERKFDCSSRLVAESIRFGKSIKYCIDYEDPALFVRHEDAVKNKLELKAGDPIIRILKSLM